MKQKNGFIAVSLIYSFFLIFLMIMIATQTKNAQNRQLLRVFKNDLQGQLNEEEFVVTSLKNRTYNVDEEVSFVNETWQVIQNKPNSVVLILKRSLNRKEVTEALRTNTNNTAFFANTCNNDNDCRVKMCLNGYTATYCYFENTASYNYYNWDNSTAKTIVEYWLEQHGYLQSVCQFKYDDIQKTRICQKDTLIRMTFSDGVQNHPGYIRLATLGEVNGAQGKSWISNGRYAWTVQLSSRSGGKSNLYDLNKGIVSNENTRTIRPVIEVRKS